MYQLYRSNSSSVCNSSTRICVLFNQDHDEYLRKSAFGGEDRATIEDCIYEEDQSSESLGENNEESLLNNICTQTSRAKLKEKIIQAKPSSEEIKTNTTGVPVCVQIEEAMHLPKWLSGEERIEPISYVTCTLMDNELTTGLSAHTAKPSWNFRKELRLDSVEHLKETCIKCVVWRCVGSSVNKTNDLQIGTAKIDTAPLFFGKSDYLNNFFFSYTQSFQGVGEMTKKRLCINYGNIHSI